MWDAARAVQSFVTSRSFEDYGPYRDLRLATNH